MDWQAALDANWREGIFNGQPYGYTAPSPDRHRRQQWLWDSCFHAIMLARFRPDRAKTEIRTLLSARYESGLVPMLAYRVPELPWREAGDKLLWRRFFVKNGVGTILTQPPVIAQAVERIYAADGDMDFVKEVLPLLKGYYRFLADQRDPDGDGLVSVIHPLESGTDMLSEFDEMFYGRHLARIPFYRFARNYFLNTAISKHFDRGQSQPLFDCRQTMFNSIYALNLSVLSDLLALAGDPEAAAFAALAERTAQAVYTKMWDGQRGIFVSLYSGDKRTDMKTISSLFPIILPGLPDHQKARIVALLADPKEFDTPYGIPSVAVSEPHFNPRASHYLWQGTAWINANWFIYHGLIRQGEAELAEQIAASSRELIRRSGFREYYNPLTGEGYGDANHGWSTLVYDMVAR